MFLMFSFVFVKTRSVSLSWGRILYSFRLFSISATKLRKKNEKRTEFVTIVEKERNQKDFRQAEMSVASAGDSSDFWEMAARWLQAQWRRTEVTAGR
jgi:hypothetical protein